MQLFGSFLSSNMIRTLDEITVLSLQTVTLACVCCRYTDRLTLCLACWAAAQQQHGEFKCVGHEAIYCWARGGLVVVQRITLSQTSLC